MKSGKRKRRLNRIKKLRKGNLIQFKGSKKRGIFKGMSKKTNLALVKISPDYIEEVPLKNIKKITEGIINA